MGDFAPIIWFKEPTNDKNKKSPENQRGKIVRIPKKSQNQTQVDEAQANSGKKNSDVPKTVVANPNLLLQRVYADPRSLTPTEASTLQHTIGNQALGRLSIQRKMTVGPVGDKYEQEADAIAKQVVDSIHTPKTQAAPKLSAQRQEEDDELAQMKPQLIQRDSAAGFATDDTFETNLNSQRGGGTPLPASLRADFEPKFGANFSGVRVHTNDQSHQLNQSIQAKAFTTGQDVFFRQGAYEPGSQGGQELIAHELTHVVQQNGRAVERKESDNVNDTQNNKANAVVQREIDSSPSPFLPTGSTSWKEKDDETTAKQKKIDDKAFIDTKAGVADFVRLNDGTLAGLAAALTAIGHITEGIFLDDYLLNIVKGPFEENWFKAKACLTTDLWPGVENPPSHAASISLMAALVNMRGRAWDRFVKAVQPKIKDEVERVKQTGPKFSTIGNPENLDENFGLKEAVGSESVTSDIDLSAKGENTEIGVAMINKEFPTYFGVSVEPGALFDINVYSSDWMFGGKEVKGEDGVFTINPNKETKLNKKNRKKKDDQNEIWSMVKIRRNMTAVDWSIYRAQLLGGLTESDDIKDMKRKFDVADAEFKTFHNTVKREAAILERALSHEERQQRSAFADRNGKDHFGEEALEMAASNRQYEKIILKVKALRLQIKNLQSAKASPAVIERIALDMHNEIARGLTYANEVYATEGAVLHTVYGKQGKVKQLAKLQSGKDTSKFMDKDSIEDVKYLLTKEQYLQSVNENVGDSLHSLEHNAKDPQYAVYRAGKYIDRLCEATVELIGAKKAKEIKAYPKMREIGSHATEEKKGAAGKDPAAVHDDTSFFSQYEKRHLNLVKVWTMDLGSRASSIFKSTK